MKKPFNEIMADLEFLLRNYSDRKRSMVNPYRLADERGRDSNYEYVPGDTRVHESLMEHVGMLPALAAYFHGYVTEPVNLGRALEMLAVHDIGELALGDINLFVKKLGDKDAEKEEALKLLDPNLHSAYLEFEALETNEAKFAKSIDKISPDLLDLITDRDVTIRRLKHYADLEPDAIVPAVIKFKVPYMQWSAFFREFHAELIQKLKEVFPSNPL